MLRFVCGLLFLSAALAMPIPQLGDSGELKYHALAPNQHNSLCLDGSPYGFYYAPATDPQYSKTTVIFAQGGGWCYNELDCLYRSQGSVGTSKGWPASTSVGGIMSDDCDINPDFCKANRVFLPYCDGNSFSGTRQDPLIVNNTPLYFRGRFNLEAALIELKDKFDLKSQDSVLFSGCSAGGLTVFLHADYMNDWLVQNVPSVRKFGAVPLSGYFLNHNNVEDVPIYGPEIQTIYNLSQPELNAGCSAAKKPADKWQCNLAAESYKYIKSPIFVINSAIDSWQTACILSAEPVVDEAKSHANGNCSAAVGWNKCAGNLQECSADQIRVYNGFASEFVGSMREAATYDKAGNGAFLYSCHYHCAGQSNYFATIKVNGVTMQQAVNKWWFGDSSAPASGNNYLPCYFSYSKPYVCNPTCTSSTVARVEGHQLVQG